MLWLGTQALMRQVITSAPSGDRAACTQTAPCRINCETVQLREGWKNHKTKSVRESVEELRASGIRGHIPERISGTRPSGHKPTPGAAHTGWALSTQAPLGAGPEAQPGLKSPGKENRREWADRLRSFCPPHVCCLPGARRWEAEKSREKRLPRG